VLQFVLNDPRRQDADSERELHEFLDGFHAAQLNKRVQHHVFLEKYRSTSRKV
jgi:hypothetical protein